MTITVTDETFAGQVLNELLLEFKTEWVTVEDIISARVQQEVDSYNKRLPEFFKGLIEPSDAEKTLNGFKLKPLKKIDAEKQIYTALHAFQNNGFFVLVDNFQSDSLQQRLELKHNTTVSFIKLTPLVGG